MAKLVTDDEFAEVRDVFADVGETFYQLPAVVKKRVSTLDRWNRDRTKKADYEDKPLNVMITWDDGSERGQVQSTRQGSFDFAEGIVVCLYDDALEQGLIDGNGAELIEPEKDLFVANGRTYDIIGANVTDQWKDKPVHLKIHIKKQLQKNT